MPNTGLEVETKLGADDEAFVASWLAGIQVHGDALKGRLARKMRRLEVQKAHENHAVSAMLCDTMTDEELDPIIRCNNFLAQKNISSSLKIMPSSPLAKDPRPRSQGLSARLLLDVPLSARRGGEPQDVMASLKAIARLKPVLRRRFSNVYEAYTYCDQTGCGYLATHPSQNRLAWPAVSSDRGVKLRQVTANQLKLELCKLDIANKDWEENTQAKHALCADQAARFFGREREDGTIDSNEFVRILAWHDLPKDIGQELKALRPHREGIVAKALGLTQAEQVFASSNPPWITKSSTKIAGSKGSKAGKGLTNKSFHKLERGSCTGSAISHLASGASNVETAVSYTSSTANGTNAHQTVQSDASARSVCVASDAGQPAITASSDSNAPRDIFHVQGVKGGNKITKGSKNNRQAVVANQTLHTQVDVSWRRMPASFYDPQQEHERLNFIDSEQRRERGLRWAGNTPFSALAAVLPPKSKGSQGGGAKSLFSRSSHLDNKLSAQAKRKRLFFLFQKYDEDGDGSLDAGEVRVLLSDMGHGYEEEDVRNALELVATPVPGKFDSAIPFQDFCEWWECLDWFHQQGIHEGALSMASTKYRKSEWLEALEVIKNDLHTVNAEQASATLDYQQTLKWYDLRYPEEPADIQNTGTFRPSTEILTTANDFFEYTQKEISQRVKGNFAAGLLSKKRNVAAEMLAASSRKPQKKPQKYLAP